MVSGLALLPEVFLALGCFAQLYVRLACADIPQGDADVNHFPASCTGPGAEIGCTRLTPPSAAPHRIICSTCVDPEPTALSLLRFPVATDDFSARDGYASKTALIEWTRSAIESMPRVKIDVEQMDGAGWTDDDVVQMDGAGDEVYFVHATRATNGLGFIDDIWVSIRSAICMSPADLCTTESQSCPIPIYEVWIQAQLRMGKGAGNKYS